MATRTHKTTSKSKTIPLTVNTLVYHKKLRPLGIGCVSKVSASRARVNFGLSDVKTCALTMLEPIDTSKYPRVSFEYYRSAIMDAASEPSIVVLGNEVRQYVGIGWITLRVVTEDDLKKYPRVVDGE